MDMIHIKYLTINNTYVFSLLRIHVSWKDINCFSNTNNYAVMQATTLVFIPTICVFMNLIYYKERN